MNRTHSVTLFSYSLVKLLVCVQPAHACLTNTKLKTNTLVSTYSMPSATIVFTFLHEIHHFFYLKLCCMKVEVDMEKISAEIAAAEEAARKRMADREKDAGDRGAREAPTCVLAEEEKHICATHGNKSQQNSLTESSNKEGEDAESNSTDTPGEPHWPVKLRCSLMIFIHLTSCNFLVSLTQGSRKPQRSSKLIRAVRRGRQRTRRASQREPWRREPATVTQAQRPPLLRQKTPRLVSHQRGPAGQEQPTECVNCEAVITSVGLRYHPLTHSIISVCQSIWRTFRWAQCSTSLRQRWGFSWAWKHQGSQTWIQINEKCKALGADKAKVLSKISGCSVCNKSSCYESTIFPPHASLPSGRTRTSPLQHILIHISRTMSGRSN